MTIFGVDYGGGNCSPKCGTMVVTVPKLPNLGDADRDHIYMTPDNKTWIPNYNGTGWVELTKDIDTNTITVVESADDNVIVTKDSKDNTVTYKVSHKEVTPTEDTGDVTEIGVPVQPNQPEPVDNGDDAPMITELPE